MLGLRRAGGCCALVLASAWPRLAHAEDATLAESLFREGKELMAKGDYAHGCPKLAESYRQAPASGTLLALAYCEEQAGHTATAWGTYNEAAVRSRQEGRADREQAARERASALEPKLAHLTIEVGASASALPGVVVKRDGQPVPQAAWGSATPIDPGDHLVEATADGMKPWSQNVHIGAGADAQKLVVPALEAAPAAAPASAAAASPAQEATPVAPKAKENNTGNTLRIAGLVTGGAGIVALGVGIGFGLHAKSLDDQSKENGHCDASTCDDKGYELNESARSAAGVSTAFFVAGGVLIAGGVTLFLVGGSEQKKAATVGVSPLVAGQGAGLLVHGGF